MKKILLADDSITIQKVVELTFSDGNYQVFCVSNGAQALRKIAEVRPDVVLLDVIMPEKSGYEVCEALKADPATASIPVLLLTGTFEPFDRRRADAAGASGHLTKPFESHALVGRVEEMIAQGGKPTAPAAAPPGAAPEPSAAPAGHPAYAAPDDAAGGSYMGFGDLGLDDVEETITPDRFDQAPSPSATVRLSRESIPASPQPAPPPAPLEEEISASSADADGPMEGFVSGYEMPPGTGRSAQPSSWERRAEPAVRAAAPAPETRPAGSDAAAAPGEPLPPEALDRLAEMVVRKMSDRVVREIAWEVIPGVAEALVRQRIKELEEGER